MKLTKLSMQIAPPACRAFQLLKLHAIFPILPELGGKSKVLYFPGILRYPRSPPAGNKTCHRHCSVQQPREQSTRSAGPHSARQETKCCGNTKRQLKVPAVSRGNDKTCGALRATAQVQAKPHVVSASTSIYVNTSLVFKAKDFAICNYLLGQLTR